MRVEELLQELKNGRTMGSLAEEIGVNPSTGIQRKLKRLGYKYDVKEWKWVGQGEEPLHVDLTATFITPKQRVNDNKATTKSKQQVNDNEIAPSKVDDGNLLTAKEIKIFRQMISKFSDQTELAAAVAGDVTLHDRLKEIKREEKVRKNVFLNKGSNDSLEEFCNRERVNKSEIIELALEDFINKYS